MHVAVLGGGLQGCCIALALAERGARVTLFERQEMLLSRAATASEGKIHLGYVYAGDRSLETARTMARGALSFAPLMERFLGSPSVAFSRSSPFAYLVHCNSQCSAEEFASHLAAAHAIVRDAAGRPGAGYFGIDLNEAPRPRSAAALEADFDPATIVAAFDTPEIAIDPLPLAESIRDRVAGEPRIELRLDQTVLAVEDAGEKLRVKSRRRDDSDRPSFDHVVNALWDGRMVIDAGRGLPPPRQWLHRFKYGIRVRPRECVSPVSVTVALGPFGDVVGYGDGSFYLCWYPTCLGGSSFDLAPPQWEPVPSQRRAAQLAAESIEALGTIVPALRRLGEVPSSNVTVKGGVIVAWGQTDIDDPASGLHRRSQIGVSSTGRYHSVDPGKLTMIPFFAAACAERIMAV